jgi:hypothetical protein
MGSSALLAEPTSVKGAMKLFPGRRRSLGAGPGLDRAARFGPVCDGSGEAPRGRCFAAPPARVLEVEQKPAAPYARPPKLTKAQPSPWGPHHCPSSRASAELTVVVKLRKEQIRMAPLGRDRKQRQLPTRRSVARVKSKETPAREGSKR